MPSPARFCYSYPRPSVTTDVALLTLREQRLQLLLIRRSNPPHADMWALPGGFLEMDEDLPACAARELAEETGVSDVRLRQLYTFGRPDRDPRGRVISVAYYALLPARRLPGVRAASDASEAAWFPLDDLPSLAFDHAEIIALAQRRLAAELDDCKLALQLLPAAFTLSELQQAYEAVLGAPLDKRNFRKRMLALGDIEETGRLRRTGRHRPAREYRIKHRVRVEYER
jgi:8-oxo-dGTP diphosphatase